MKFVGGFEKISGLGKGLIEGLIGAGELTAENIARKAGRSVRKAALPAGAAGGTAVIMKSKESKDAHK